MERPFGNPMRGMSNYNCGVFAGLTWAAVAVTSNCQRMSAASMDVVSRSRLELCGCDGRDP